MFTDYNMTKLFYESLINHLAKMILNLITSQAQPNICVSVFEIQEVCNVTSHFVGGHTECP